MRVFIYECLSRTRVGAAPSHTSHSVTSVRQANGTAAFSHPLKHHPMFTEDAEEELYFAAPPFMPPNPSRADDAADTPPRPPETTLLQVDMDGDTACLRRITHTHTHTRTRMKRVMAMYPVSKPLRPPCPLPSDHALCPLPARSAHLPPACPSTGTGHPIHVCLWLFNGNITPTPPHPICTGSV